jgi:uncharacterized membrane protein YphA (DoxX/SURF4 family)
MRTFEDKTFALLRIAFGFVWAVDAYFKWQPAFLNNFTSYLSEGAQGQPALVQAWINLWIHGVAVNPHLFGIIVALGESAIALGLLFGFFTRVALAGGILMALVIWTTAEGFGGPYVAGSTDIGAAIIYLLVFVALWLGKCWRHFSVDSRLASAAPWLFGN